MKIKICPKCGKRKSLKEFYVRKSAKDGLQHQCKQCAKEYVKEYYNANAEHIKEIVYKWRADHPQYKEQWLRDNTEKVKEIRAKAQAKRLQTFDGKNNNSLSALASRIIKGAIKSSPFLERVLGCTPQQFVDDIVFKFEPGMSLENYGKAWEIDHKIAKALLPYESFEDPNFKKLWCLENLRPLRRVDNQKKGKKATKRIKNENQQKRKQSLQKH